MRVYHFVSGKFGLDDLRERRLKIATISDLNDPFELRAMAIGRRQDRHAFQQWRLHLAGRIGMLCFSTAWQNPVQWSHYAEKHTGLCLGFDVPDQLLMPVEYRVKLHPDLISPAVDANDEAEGESAMRKLLSTKYSHWRYEREVRIFVELAQERQEGNLYFHPFDVDMKLAEVIVGAQSAITRADISEALGCLSGDVNVMKARLAFRSFRIVRQRDSSLWL